MNTIDEFTIVSTISDISNLLYSYNDDLEELKEKASDIIEKANALDSYNGLKVSGSDRIEYSLESTKFYYDKLTITGTAEVISNSNYILKEIDRLQTNITSFRNVNLNEFDEAITKVAIYIANLETALALGVISSNKTYDKMSTSDKLYYAGQLISKDKELNRKIKEYDQKIAKTTNSDEVKKIVLEMLTLYKDNETTLTQIIS